MGQGGNEVGDSWCGHISTHARIVAKIRSGERGERSILRTSAKRLTLYEDDDGKIGASTTAMRISFQQDWEACKERNMKLKTGMQNYKLRG